MVETRTDNKTTTIRVKNWALYQGNGDQKGEQTGDQKGEQKESRLPTDKNVQNVHNGNTTRGVVFENEFFAVTTSQLDEWKRSYPLIKKFHRYLIKVSDRIREKQRKGEATNSPSAFLHDHLRREQEKLSAKKETGATIWGPDTRSGEGTSVGKILKDIVADAQGGNGAD
jgi:hypothetical protein